MFGHGRVALFACRVYCAEGLHFSAYINVVIIRLWTALEISKSKILAPFLVIVNSFVLFTYNLSELDFYPLYCWWMEGTRGKFFCTSNVPRTRANFTLRYRPNITLSVERSYVPRAPTNS